MSVEDIYIKPLEQILVEGKISIYYQPNFNAETGEKEPYWGCYSLKKLSVNGRGATPKEAVVDLYKKL